MMMWHRKHALLVWTWSMHAETQKRLYLKAYTQYNRWATVLGVLATVVSVIGGPGTIVSNLSDEMLEDCEGSPFRSWPFAFQVLATCSAVLTPLVVYLSWDTKADMFQTMAVRWDTLARKMEREGQSSTHALPYKVFMDKVLGELEDLEAHPLAQLPGSIHALREKVRNELFVEAQSREHFEVRWRRNMEHIHAGDDDDERDEDTNADGDDGHENKNTTPTSMSSLRQDHRRHHHHRGQQQQPSLTHIG